MELIERYLQAVKFWLPKAQKQDIIAELSADIYSQVEEKESSLGRSLNKAEVEEILKQRGRPVLVANRYQPQQYLIGPVLFPIYAFVLKMIAVGYLLPWTMIWIAITIYSPTYRTTHGGWPGAIGTVWASLWSMSFFVIGTATVVFAVLEQVQAKNRFMEKWEPRKLPPVKNPNQIKRFNSIVEIVAVGLGIVWWLSYFSSRQILNYPGIRIVLTSSWWYFYWGFLAANVANITLSAFNLARPYWTAQRAMLKLVIDLVGSGLFCWLVKVHLLGEIVVRGMTPERAATMVQTINNLMALCFLYAVLVCAAIAFGNAYRIIRVSRETNSPLLETLVAGVS